MMMMMIWWGSVKFPSKEKANFYFQFQDFTVCDQNKMRSIDIPFFKSRSLLAGTYFEKEQEEENFFIYETIFFLHSTFSAFF